MKDLRIHVERIVRPIRASVPRKNKMREELLAHLRTAFDEERVDAATEDEALERAKQRLGDSQALRDELQSSVPWYEQLGHTRIPVGLKYERSTECGWRASARLASETVLCLVAGYPVYVAYAFIVTFVSGLSRPGLADVAQDLPMIVGLLACLWLLMFAAFWMFDVVGARKRVAPWSKTPALVKASLTTLLLVFAGGLFLTVAIGFTKVVQAHTKLDDVAYVLYITAVTIPYGL
jgi:hypothetical protein